MSSLRERMNVSSMATGDDTLDRVRAALAGAGEVVAAARRDPGARRYLEQAIASAVAQEGQPSTPDRVARLAEELLGYGPLQPLLEDPAVTDIMVNAPDAVYVERGGRLERTQARFRDEAHIVEVARRIAAGAGRRLDAAHPYVDARLPDGSRFHAVLPPIAIHSPCMTIRRFGRTFPSLDELVQRGALSVTMSATLARAVRSRMNVLIAGNTGSGKTTLLNALCGAVAPHERVITIEDAAELRLPVEHVVALECRPPNVEGQGAVTLRDLVRNALRMRPDRLVIGEMRGAEAFDVLQAWHTGHRGSLCTLHANGPVDALDRFATLAALAGEGVPFDILRAQVQSAVDLVVFLERDPEGGRRVSLVCEVRDGRCQPLSIAEDGGPAYVVAPAVDAFHRRCHSAEGTGRERKAGG
ncbi:MAG: CpaF family protein [Clostridia bacterium]|nr:CpaF family protein [Clostridia bacterium]